MTAISHITKRTITAQYPSYEMKVGKVQYRKNAYKSPAEQVEVNIWNGDIQTRQTVIFDANDFVAMMTETEEGTALWENCYQVLQHSSVQEAIEDGELDMDEIEMAVRLSHRIRFSNN